MAEFIPGKTFIPASGAVLGDAEKDAMRAVVGSGWLTAGPVNAAFERALSEFTGIRHVRTCNSGSSANLLAVAAMVEAGIWKAGDEIITSACGFPTTVNPLLLYGLVPVFVDVEIGTYNPTVYAVADAVSPRTTGMIFAHTLGNPLDMNICRTFLPTIHDCCDALGATYSNGLHVGRSADIATCSFFPAHHITTGEGGAVFTHDARVLRIIESVRDWGRDCYCDPGQNNTCGKRFECQIDGIPYDHKYFLTHLGFNLKSTDVAAACGLAQLERVDSFVESRRGNFDFIHHRLCGLENHVILPQETPNTQASWFGFPITIKETGQRQALQEYLWENKIDSRLIFAGNLTRQPYMKGRNFRVVGDLRNSDRIMADGLWIGLHPALTEEMLSFVCDKIEAFFA